MQVFLTRAYDKLKKDAGRNKTMASLRDACDAASDALAAGNGGGSLVRRNSVAPLYNCSDDSACISDIEITQSLRSRCALVMSVFQ